MFGGWWRRPRARRRRGRRSAPGAPGRDGSRRCAAPLVLSAHTRCARGRVAQHDGAARRSRRRSRKPERSPTFERQQARAARRPGPCRDSTSVASERADRRVRDRPRAARFRHLHGDERGERRGRGRPPESICGCACCRRPAGPVDQEGLASWGACSGSRLVERRRPGGPSASAVDGGFDLGVSLRRQRHHHDCDAVVRDPRSRRTSCSAPLQPGARRPIREPGG